MRFPWDELGQKAAEAWLALDPETRSRTLLVAPTHELRAEINAVVREALAAEGVLRGKALRIDRLVGLGMTRAEMADVRNYREGDTVLFNQDQVNFRVRKDEALTVTGIERDRLLLMHPDGRPAPCRAGAGPHPLPAGGLRDAADRDPRRRPHPLDPQRQEA